MIIVSYEIIGWSNNIKNIALRFLDKYKIALQSSRCALTGVVK